VSIDLCGVAKEDCKTKLASIPTIDADEAAKICDDAYSTMTSVPVVGQALDTACGVLEKVQKAYDYGKMLGCAEKVLSDNRKKKKPGTGDGGDPSGGESLSDSFFNALDPGGGLIDLHGCKTCGPAITTGTGGPGCFAAGTPILMADGTRRPIETIQPGDSVRGFDGTAAMVSRVKVREADHVRELRYRDSAPEGRLRRLRTTDEHQYWVMNRDRWMPARDLQVGDRLMLPGGADAEIVETVRYPAGTAVYNFDVAGSESYFANDVLVYQECGGRTTAGVDARLRAYLRERGVFEGPDRLVGDNDKAAAPRILGRVGAMPPAAEGKPKGGRP
jgi:hypothetical protein